MKKAVRQAGGICSWRLDSEGETPSTSKTLCRVVELIWAALSVEEWRLKKILSPPERDLLEQTEGPVSIVDVFLSLTQWR